MREYLEEVGDRIFEYLEVVYDSFWEDFSHTFDDEFKEDFCDFWKCHGSFLLCILIWAFIYFEAARGLQIPDRRSIPWLLVTSFHPIRRHLTLPT